MKRVSERLEGRFRLGEWRLGDWRLVNWKLVNWKPTVSNLQSPISLLILTVLLLSACSPSPARLLQQGNDAFAGQTYDEALQAYQEAETANPGWDKALYNTANTRYRQSVYDEAQALYQQVAAVAADDLAPSGYFNLGNSFYQVEQWQTAVDAYKAALRLKPDDQEAKYNLELALQKLIEAQQQQQQQQDQQQDQSQQDQQQQDQSQQDQSQQQDQQQPNDNQQADAAQAHDQPSDPTGQSQPQTDLTPEQAQQLFASVGENADTLQEKLQQIYVVPGAPPAKDW